VAFWDNRATAHLAPADLDHLDVRRTLHRVTVIRRAPGAPAHRPGGGELTKKLSLNAFIYPAGHHEAAWRHPSSRPERIYEASSYQEIARTAEAGTLDASFFTDGPALQGDVAQVADMIEE
jgi:hypothetical protein